MKKLLATPNDWMLLVARLGLGIMILPHGLQKGLGLFGGQGWMGTVEGMGKMGMPALVAHLVIIGELFGGLGLVFGLLTRLSAAAVGGIMLVAMLMVHAKFGFFMNWMGQQQGEGIEFFIPVLALSIIGAVRGAGAFSIDRALTAKAVQ